jgi:hypothetical protein
MQFTEVEDDKQVYEALFKTLDRDSSGNITMDEIKSALTDLAAASMDKSMLHIDTSQLHDAFKALEKRLSEGKARSCLDKETFCDFMRHIPHLRGQRTQWARSLNLDRLLARRLPVGSFFDGLSGMKQMTELQLDERLRFVYNDMRTVVKSEWRRLNSARLHGTDELTVARSKFSGVVGQFGDMQMFNEGLETQIGSPDPYILKGIFRENVLSDQANKRDVTSNYQIVFSDFAEYARILGNPKEYSGDAVQTKLENSEISPKIPIFLTEIAKGLHGDQLGPSDAELTDLEGQFSVLRDFHNETTYKLKGVFPGDIGYIQKTVEYEFHFRDQTDAGNFYDCLANKQNEPELYKLFVDLGPPPSTNAVKLKFIGSLFAFASGQDSRYWEEIAQKKPFDPSDCQFDQFIAHPRSVTVHVYCEPEEMSSQVKWRETLQKYELNELIQICNLKPESDSKEKYIDVIVGEMIKSTLLTSESGRIHYMLMPGRRYLSLKEMFLLSYVRDANLRIEEVIQAHQYTGPMFQVIALLFMEIWDFCLPYKLTFVLFFLCKL